MSNRYSHKFVDRIRDQEKSLRDNLSIAFGEIGLVNPEPLIDSDGSDLFERALRLLMNDMIHGELTFSIKLNYEKFRNGFVHAEHYFEELVQKGYVGSVFPSPKSVDLTLFPKKENLLLWGYRPAEYYELSELMLSDEELKTSNKAVVSLHERGLILSRKDENGFRSIVVDVESLPCDKENLYYAWVLED